jgi:hypothetical protein
MILGLVWFFCWVRLVWLRHQQHIVQCIMQGYVIGYWVISAGIICTYPREEIHTYYDSRYNYGENSSTNHSRNTVKITRPADHGTS